VGRGQIAITAQHTSKHLIAAIYKLSKNCCCCFIYVQARSAGRCNDPSQLRNDATHALKH
jgi:hypothetical protein